VPAGAAEELVQTRGRDDRSTHRPRPARLRFGARGGDGDFAVATTKAIPMSTPSRLTDTQIMMLSSASQREDRCLIPPTDSKGGAARKAAAKLLAAGLVREIKAKAGMEAWRRDAETHETYTLKLTAAGLKAMTVDEDDAEHDAGANVPAVDKVDSSKVEEAPNMPTIAKAVAAATTTSVPRDGTKIADVIAMLRRKQGAKLDDLVATTGWLPHTARAALTGLRHRGYDVQLERGGAAGASVYRIAAVK
jgi:hypothetical protein